MDVGDVGEATTGKSGAIISHDWDCILSGLEPSLLLQGHYTAAVLLYLFYRILEARRRLFHPQPYFAHLTHRHPTNHCILLISRHTATGTGKHSLILIFRSLSRSLNDLNCHAWLSTNPIN
jgi:hypothetical protein